MTYTSERVALWNHRASLLGQAQGIDREIELTEVKLKRLREQAADLRQFAQSFRVAAEKLCDIDVAEAKEVT